MQEGNISGYNIKKKFYLYLQVSLNKLQNNYGCNLLDPSLAVPKIVDEEVHGVERRFVVISQSYRAH